MPPLLDDENENDDNNGNEKREVSTSSSSKKGGSSSTAAAAVEEEEDDDEEEEEKDDDYDPEEDYDNDSDEIYTYNEEEEEAGDDDDDESECQCPRCQARIEMGDFYQFLNSQFDEETTTQQSSRRDTDDGDGEEEDNDDDDDDDNDSEECDCSSCQAERRYREEEEDSDDDDDSSHSSMPPLEGDDDDAEVDAEHSKDGTKVKSKDDGEDDEKDSGWAQSSEDEGEDVSCTVCFEPPTKKNPIVILPCCDPNGTSSMKFCQNCIVKSVKATQDNNEEPEEMMREMNFGPFRAVIAGMRSSRNRSSNRIDGCDIGECPRCRKLLCVAKKKQQSNKSKSTSCISSNKKSKRVLIKTPTYEQSIIFAAKRNDDFKDLLFFLSFAHYHIVPMELLQYACSCPNGVATKRIHQLCQWGILETVKVDKLYKIEPGTNQKLVRKLMTTKDSEFRPVFGGRRGGDDSDDDDYDEDNNEVTREEKAEKRWLSKAMNNISNIYIGATINAVLECRILLGVQIANQCMIHTLWKYWGSFVPSDVTSHDMGQILSRLVGITNVVIAGLLIILGIGAGSLIGIGYCGVKSVSWLIKNHQLEDKVEKRNNWISAMGQMVFVTIWKYGLKARFRNLVFAYVMYWMIKLFWRILTMMNLIEKVDTENPNGSSHAGASNNNNNNSNTTTMKKLRRWLKRDLLYKSSSWSLPCLYLLWCLPTRADHYPIVLCLMAYKVIHESSSWPGFGISSSLMKWKKREQYCP